MEIIELKQKFKEIFKSDENLRTFFAPGRVNLIGEHIDYNGGNVFPAALDIGTYAVARKIDERRLKMSSLNMKLSTEIDLKDIKYKEKDGWTNYPKGVLKMIEDTGKKIDSGLEILYYGNIPNGAGLSSSASLELVTAVLINKMFNFDIDMVELVKLSQKAENDFVGVNCGIMDQFAIGMGKKDMAIKLDCDTLEYTYAPLEMDSHKLIIANTNKQRGLADSKYNERRRECEQALSELQNFVDIENLAELTPEEFNDLKDNLSTEVLQKRAKHVVTENDRTNRAVDALKAGKLDEFGKLMNDSHISLRDDYEVTGIELDTLAQKSWEIDGCLGSRMTGAGFGGCTVSLVEEEAVDNFIEKVGKYYEKKTGLVADFYVVEVGDGARELK